MNRVQKVSDRTNVVRCKDCMFYQPPQVALPDGTCRDYLPDEIDPFLGRPGVTADIGINVGGYCNGYWTDDYVADGRHEWKSENDFCSRGCKPGEESWRMYMSALSGS